MAATTAEQVADAVRPCVERAGLVLDDVKVARAGARSVVRVVVDLDEDATGAVGLEQVAEVSRLVSDTLDEQGTVAGAYTLEVSSPGTGRPLTELRHFKRARTRLVVVELREGGTYTGRLTAVAGDDLVFDDGARTLALGDVVRGTVEVELKRAASLDDDDFVDVDEPGTSGRTDGEG